MNGRRSFLQGRGLLSLICAGYNDAQVQGRDTVLDSSNVSTTSSIVYSQADTNASSYVMFKQPDYVGYWQLVPPPYSFRVATLHKPSWFHRKMIQLFFGWSWHDGKLDSTI